jgi:hypothetical protein
MVMSVEHPLKIETASAARRRLAVARMDLPLFDKMDRANGKHPFDKMVRVHTLLKGYFRRAVACSGGAHTFSLIRHAGPVLDLGPIDAPSVRGANCSSESTSAYESIAFSLGPRSGNKEKTMDTIHPLGLATMMATHQPFALIDVRPRDQFQCSHICGAHSIPLNGLCPAKIVREHGECRTVGRGMTS